MSAIFFGCKQNFPKLDHSLYAIEIKEGWPEMPITDSNPLTLASIDFGRQLFFDKRLSQDSTVSCGSCHKPLHGFADNVSLSAGINGSLGFRNSGSLTNVGYLPYFNRDGGVKTLDRFSIVPIEDHDEMGFNLVRMRKRLAADPDYVYQSMQIYNRPPDEYSVPAALGSFLRTFISRNSPYDKYVYDQDSTALNREQLNGMQIFFGTKGQCSTCHSGPLLTDNTFQNNGLKVSYENLDRGRQRVTNNPNDEGKFRVATLRNVALTAPYMHDGSLPDLASVIDHYARHGVDHHTKSDTINQIDLSESDKAHLISFLHALTDTSFITNSLYQNEAITYNK